MTIAISYKVRSETAELAGRTVAEARERYQNLFAIPAKARAILNGQVVAREDSVKLNDCDELGFVEMRRSKLPMLVGALLLAMALTGGMFAYTYVTATSTLSVTAGGADFAAVSENTSSPPTWSVCGYLKGSTGTGPIFDVNTLACGYTGDLTVTVSLANANQLAKVYRNLSLKLEVYKNNGTKVDINGDAVVNDKDFTLLTISNGEANFFITQSEPNQYTVKVVSGYYSSNIWGAGWTAGYEDPVLFAEVHQR